MDEQETTVIDSWFVIQLGELFLADYETHGKGFTNFKFVKQVLKAKRFGKRENASNTAKACGGDIQPVYVEIGVPTIESTN